MKPMVWLVQILVVVAASPACAQRRQNPPGPDTLGLTQGTIDLETPEFTLKLVRSSQTVAALQPKGAGGFDFTPADRLIARSANRFHHLGDLIFRVRTGTTRDWTDYDTARDRHPVRALLASSDTLAAADLTPTLPADCPIQVTRAWALESGRLALRFTLKNTSAAPVQIGALGIPVVFNNILTGRSLKQAHETCSFFDPNVGRDAGYLQVTRLSGPKGGALTSERAYEYANPTPRAAGGRWSDRDGKNAQR